MEISLSLKGGKFFTTRLQVFLTLTKSGNEISHQIRTKEW